MLKDLFQQPRPALSLHGVHLLTIHGIPTPTINSFPSGDAALAFAIAMALAPGEKWYVQALLFVYALLIAYERVYVGVHFPLDVMSGALLGVLCAGAAVVVIIRVRHKRAA